jgi:hypothetical protein
MIWDTKMRIRAYPVQDCGTNLCWSYLHMITSWYTTPRPHRSTFLLTDAAQPIPATPTANLGTPSATQQIGPFTVYVYPYDIAGRMMP